MRFNSACWDCIQEREGDEHKGLALCPKSLPLDSVQLMLRVLEGFSHMNGLLSKSYEAGDQVLGRGLRCCVTALVHVPRNVDFVKFFSIWTACCQCLMEPETKFSEEAFAAV